MYEGFQNGFISPVFFFDQGVQFAVRKSSCTALAKLYVGILQKLAALPELFHICFSAVHITAPFQNHGPIPVESQKISAKKSCRSHSHYDNGLVQLSGATGRKLILHRIGSADLPCQLLVLCKLF